MNDRVTDQVSYLIAQAAWLIDAQVKAIVATANLSVEQWRVLTLLDEQGGRSMRDLAQQAFVEAATLTKMIDRLVSDALVYRAPDARDRRRVLIFLSLRGKDRVDALRPLVAAQDAAAQRRLGPSAVAALREAAGVLTRSEAPAGRGLKAARPIVVDIAAE